MDNHLKEMLLTLTERGVEFVIGGGVACVLHGVERVTLDLDIAVRMTPDNLERLAGATDALNLRPRVPIAVAKLNDPESIRSMVEDKGALVFSLTDPDQPLRQLDIFIHPALSFERLSDGAASFNIGPTKIRVVSKDLLMRIKREIQPLRPKDVLDLAELGRTSEEPPS